MIEYGRAEVEAWQRGQREALIAHTASEIAVEVLVDERDRARDLAAALEAQLAEAEEKYLDGTQRYVDDVCFYRNLAIVLGAKPTDMRCDLDRNLCERWPEMQEGWDGATEKVEYERAEQVELWAEHDEAVTLLRETRDELDEWGWIDDLDTQPKSVVEAVAKVDQFLGRIDAAQPPIRADSDPPV